MYKGKKVWIDFTNAPHVLVLKPLIDIFESKGIKTVVTARNFSQTLSLLDRFGIPYHEIGEHQGKSLIKKSLGFFHRTSKLLDFVKKERLKFDLALSHSSNDLALASYLLRVPHVTMFDYEYAAVSHHVNFRLSKKVMCPDVIDKQVLRRYSRKDKMDQYEGLKEEYYMHGWTPDAKVIDELALDTSKIIVMVRTPPELALYHRFENNVFADVLKSLSIKDVQVVVLPRTPEQKDEIKSLDYKNFIIPEKAIDAQSLIYYADLVISAGGTMNREAVVLKTPVYSLFSGKMGAVDIDLINKGKLIKLDDAENIRLLKKNDTDKILNLRDPEILAQKILKAMK